MTKPLNPKPVRWRPPKWDAPFLIINLLLVLAFGVALIWFKVGFLPFFLFIFGIHIPFHLLNYSQKKYAKQVLCKSGVTCPCCLTILGKDDENCSHCTAGLNRAAYVDYWTQAEKTPPLANGLWRAHQAAEHVPDRMTYSAIQYRWHIGLLLGSFVLVGIPAILYRPALIISMYDPGFFLFFCTVIGGGWLMQRHAVRRVGKTKHCAQCEYQIDPARPDMAQCPECGSAFDRPGKTKKGRRVGHTGYILLGAAILMTPIVFMFLPLFSNFGNVASPSNYLPVSLYVDDALSLDPDYSTWDVLESRYAKPEDIRRLVNAMIARLNDGSIKDDPSWHYRMNDAILHQLTAPQLPDGVEQDLAMALLSSPDQNHVFDFNDWLQNYIKSVAIGSTDGRALLAALEASFRSGDIGWTNLQILQSHRSVRLRVHSEFRDFCRDLLEFNSIQTEDGPRLAIGTNPDTSLSAETRPEKPTWVYLYSVGSRNDPADRRVLGLYYDPFDYIGTSHTFTHVPEMTSDYGTVPSTLIYFVCVSDECPPPSAIPISERYPMLPPNSERHAWYGPYELTSGLSSAFDMQGRP